MRVIRIYALIDPRVSDAVQRVRYVGKTSLTVDQRIAMHISASRDPRSRQGKLRCARWIRTLLARGLRPQYEMVAEVSFAESNLAECAAIAAYRAKGCPLTNLTDGGEGTSGYKKSDAARARQSELNRGHKIWLGRKHTLATRLKMSQRQRGEFNSSALLSNFDAILIRKLYSGGGFTYPQLAEKFNVSKTTVWAVVRMKRFVDVSVNA